LVAVAVAVAVFVAVAVAVGVLVRVGVAVKVGVVVIVAVGVGVAVFVAVGGGVAGLVGVGVAQAFTIKCVVAVAVPPDEPAAWTVIVYPGLASAGVVPQVVETVSVTSSPVPHPGAVVGKFELAPAGNVVVRL